MATRRDREQKAERERERFLKELADADTIQAAWRLIMKGRDAPFRSNAGYTVRYGMVPGCDATEQRAYEALLERLKAKGYRWERTGDRETFPVDPDGNAIIIP